MNAIQILTDKRNMVDNEIKLEEAAIERYEEMIEECKKTTVGWKFELDDINKAINLLGGGKDGNKENINEGSNSEEKQTEEKSSEEEENSEEKEKVVFENK